MFKCYHCGRCCEDVATQISLTLGDIQRLSSYLKKSALQLYSEKIIGIYPFGNPIENGIYETEIGLFIPCSFRKLENNTSKIKQCSIYPARPLNCRLFPYWILSEAPINELKAMGSYHVCMDKLKVDSDFSEERKIYFEYREAIIAILEQELQDTEDIMAQFSVRKKIRAKKTKTREEDANVISNLIQKNLHCRKDWQELFKAIDTHLQKKQYTKSEDIPSFENFLK